MPPTKTDPRTHADLLDAVRNGDTTITAADLATAKAREEFDAAVGDHAAAVAEQARLQRLEADRDVWRREYREAIDERIDAGKAAYRVCIDPAPRQCLVDAIAAYNATVIDLRARAEQLGIGDEATVEPLLPSGILTAADRDRAGEPLLSLRILADTPQRVARHPFTDTELADCVDRELSARDDAIAERAAAEAAEQQARDEAKQKAHPDRRPGSMVLVG